MAAAAAAALHSLLALENGFCERCARPHNINEHMGVLRALASQCTHVTEAGVEGVFSSYAFATGLLNGGGTGKKLVQIDPVKSSAVDAFGELARRCGIECVFYNMSDLDSPLENTDLLFIDTWHVYGHLKRELARWHTYVARYIVLHDTTVDADVGESIRMRMNVTAQQASSGYPLQEIMSGIWKAVEEFLADRPEWTLLYRFAHNNGLTVLRRIEAKAVTDVAAVV